MIEMIAGVFGLPVNGIVRAMDNKSGPFEADAEQESRLVSLGLAKYVDHDESVNDEGERNDTGDGEPIGFDEIPEDLLTDGAEEVDLSTMSAKELREIGKEYGLTFKGNASKAEMIQAIQEAQATEDAEDYEEDDEPAPEFDAAEAVV